MEFQSSFFSLFPASDPVKDYSQIINSDYGVWYKKQISSVEYLTLTENHPKFVQPNQPKHLEVNIGSYKFARIRLVII